jgi:acylphosphatase
MSAQIPPAADAPVARLVRYSGRVQGVGFRATTAAMARQQRVTGYVKNLADGRVEALVEGPPAAVEALLQTIATYWVRYIDNAEVQEQVPTGRYARFEIAR